jgi:hypothetical protein
MEFVTITDVTTGEVTTSRLLTDAEIEALLAGLADLED